MTLVHFPPISRENDLVYAVDLRMAIKGFRDNITLFLWAITLTAKVVALVSHSLQHGSPFGCLERDTIGPCKAGGDKSDVSGGGH